MHVFFCFSFNIVFFLGTILKNGVVLDCVGSHSALLVHVCVCVCLGLQVEAAGWELSKGQQLQTAVETVT